MILNYIHPVNFAGGGDPSPNLSIHRQQNILYAA
jgi:hypothetical protein